VDGSVQSRAGGVVPVGSPGDCCAAAGKANAQPTAVAVAALKSSRLSNTASSLPGRPISLEMRLHPASG
jgi:hypothetical protein